MPAKKKKAKLKKSTAARKKIKKKSVKKSVKKKATRKKAAHKKTAGKKRITRTEASSFTAKEAVAIEPGPPTVFVPPVEEPAANEQAIGTVTHYYSHLSVAIIQINKGVLKTGGTIHVKGHTTDFFQPIESMEYEHQHVDQAGAGQSVGLKVKDHAREHDIVYLVR